MVWADVDWANVAIIVEVGVGRWSHVKIEWIGAYRFFQSSVEPPVVIER